MKRNRSPRQSGPAVHSQFKPRRVPRRWFIAGLLLAIGGGLAWWVARTNRPVPSLPDISLAGLEPVVIQLIERSMEDVRQSPRSAKAWGVMGMVLRHYDFAPAAIACFQAAERYDKNDPRWPYWSGILISRHQPETALTQLKKAVDRNEDQTDGPRLRLALLLEELGHWEEASREFQTLVQSQSNHTPALLGLARLDLAGDQLAAAAAKLRRCVDSPYTAKAAHVLLSSVERRLGRSSAANALARQAEALPPDAPWPDPFLAEAETYHVGEKAWSDRAQRLLDQGKPREALTWINRLTRNYPQGADHWLLLSRARMLQEDCAGAEQALRKHLRLDPNSVNGHSELGIALLCQERYPEAVSALTQAIRLKPDHGWAHFNLGFALARDGHGHDAIPAFRAAIRYNPDFIDPYITLADLLHQAGQTREALDVLTDAEGIAPHDERIAILRQRMQ